VEFVFIIVPPRKTDLQVPDRHDKLVAAVGSVIREEPECQEQPPEKTVLIKLTATHPSTERTAEARSSPSGNGHWV